MTSEHAFKILFTGGVFLLSVSLLLVRWIGKKWWSVFLAVFSFLFFVFSIFSISFSFLVRSSYMIKDENSLSFYLDKAGDKFVLSIKDNGVERSYFVMKPPVLNFWFLSIAGLRVVKIAEIDRRYEFISPGEKLIFNFFSKLSNLLHFIECKQKKIPFIETGKWVKVGFSSEGEPFIK